MSTARLRTESANSVERAGRRQRGGDMTGMQGVRLLLVETPNSGFVSRIERAVDELGVPRESIDHIERAPAESAVVGVGPSIREPLQVARQLRRLGARVPV